MKMHNIIAFFRIVRMPNLIIIASVLYLQRLCIVLPGLQISGINLDWTGYGLIVLGTVLIAVGGYLINDFFDIAIDTVNKPDRAAVLQSISHGLIQRAYYVVTFSGLVCIALACYISSAYLLWFVYLIATLVLFWYSYRLKKVLILGNLAIAFASAFTMPVAWLFDWQILSGWNSINPAVSDIYNEISVRIIIYSLFAFLISFAREIIKDIEDMEGDSRFGCRSIPVVYGVSVAKRIIISFFALILIVLCFWQIDLFKTGHSNITIYLAIAVDLPLLWLTVFVFRMRTKAENHRSGLTTKIIMVTGVLSMLWFLF